MKNLPLPFLILALACSALAEAPRLSEEQIATFTRLGKEATAAYQAKDYAACAAKYEQQMAIHDGNELSAYNLTCCYALAGDKAKALAMLATSVALGFRDRDHMEKDTDLESIREDPKFAQAMAEADRLEREAAAANVDPLAGDAAPFSGLDAIDAYFREAAKKERPLLAVLGERREQEAAHRLARSRAAALREYGRTHPAEEDEAAYRALKVMAEVSGPSTILTKAADAFVAERPQSPHLPGALLLQADARLRAAGKRSEEQAEQRRLALVKVARQVVERFPDAADSRDAYARLAIDALRRNAADEGMPHYRKLKASWPNEGDHKEFWRENGYHLFEYRLRDEGAPEFSVVGTEGEKLSLASFKGKITLLEFWATWCAPCREEIPNLKATYAKHHAKGFEIVGISADDEKKLSLDAFKAWVKDKGMPWPQFYDGKGFDNELVAKYQVNGIPTSFLVDREGKVVAAQLRGEELEKKVAELLDGKSGS